MALLYKTYRFIRTQSLMERAQAVIFVFFFFFFFQISWPFILKKHSSYYVLWNIDDSKACVIWNDICYASVTYKKKKKEKTERKSPIALQCISRSLVPFCCALIVTRFQFLNAVQTCSKKPFILRWMNKYKGKYAQMQNSLSTDWNQ